MTLRPVCFALSVLLCAAVLPVADSAAQARKPQKPTRAEQDTSKQDTSKQGTAASGSAGWYALRITRGDAGVFVANFWSLGRRLRAEAVLSGVLIQQIVSGEWYYVIDAVRGEGIAVRRSAAALEFDRKHPTARPFGNEAADLVARGAEVVREEEVSGRKVQVHRLTDGQGRHEAWVTEDVSALPIRIDSTDRSSGAHIVTDYVDWLSAITPPETFFEPDPRVKIERIEYDEYLQRASREPLGPAPVLFGDLLHGP